MRHPSLISSLIAVVALGTISQVAQGDSGGNIAPIQSDPHGKTYGEWAALWWQWAIETPASENPVTDTTGEFCGVNQSGHVWFLAGLLGSGTVSRTCTIPTGTALFFPLANSFYGAFLTDPPETRTEEFLRSQVTCVEGAAVSASIDGVPVASPQRYLEKSALFDIVLPEDNVYGVTEADVPELTLSPSVDEGYYLFVQPLPPGQHQIKFSVAANASCTVPLDVTYDLTVAN